MRRGLRIRTRRRGVRDMERLASMSDKTLHIGFTGTRYGMNPHQTQALYDYLQRRTSEGEVHFHHGDCIGADAEAHRIAFLLGAILHVHPPASPIYRAYCVGPSRVIRYEPLPYLARNWMIVEACTILLAAPQTDTEVRRSGTWATIRYARRQEKRVMILSRQNKRDEQA